MGERYFVARDDQPDGDFCVYDWEDKSFEINCCHDIKNASKIADTLNSQADLLGEAVGLLNRILDSSGARGHFDREREKMANRDAKAFLARIDKEAKP